jgi:hypothetical protein
VVYGCLLQLLHNPADLEDTVPQVKINPTIILTQLSAGFFFPYNLIGGLMQDKD